MKKIIIHGPPDHILSKIILEKGREAGIEIEILKEWSELTGRLPDLKKEILVLINKNKKEALSLKLQNPNLRVMICRGGEKESQPTIVLVDAHKNHQYLRYQDFDDFWKKIVAPPAAVKLLLSALPEDDVYLVNYHNLPELIERQKRQVDQKFFWFSVYFSRIYLWWFTNWLEDVSDMKFTFDIKFHGSGKLKRLSIPFANKYQGESIFREGEEIVLSPWATDETDDYEYRRWDKFKAKQSGNKHRTASTLRQQFRAEEERQGYLIVGKVMAADEEGVEVQFKRAIPKENLSQTKSFHKGGNLLSLMTKAYSNSCAGYSDLSLRDYIYTQENYYYKPEDFLRGYISNQNKMHLPIPTVKLDGRSEVILQDRSQVEALIDIISPSFLTAVKGPPGTGKTLLTAVAIKQFVLQGQVVLVTAHSNQGLDNLLEALAGHVDPKRIFRLGNDPSLIASSKVRKWHRSERYKKQILQAKEKADRSSNRQAEVDHETNAIWELIASGKGLVLATTINSFQFDRSLGGLFSQNKTILEYINSSPQSDSLTHGLPSAVLNSLGDPKKVVPQFIIDVAIIDEATKGRFFECGPIIKAADSKLVLIGDTDQLGNINIAPDAQKEMMVKIKEGWQLGSRGKLGNLYSSLQHEAHSLSPIETTEAEINAWFDNFSQGLFHSLINGSNFVSNQLNVNRRSLAEITKLLNYVFEKDLQIGRFNPHAQGQVTFLNVSDILEERTKTSYKNKKEKAIIGQEVINFFKRQKETEGLVKLSSLGIIATYRGQVRATKERLRKDLLFHPLFSGLVNPENIDEVLNGMINTVDAFQGSERETIILSLVRANDTGQIGFSSDIRRLYVALSRARQELTIVGNADTFLHSQDKAIRKIFGRIIHFTQNAKKYSVK